MSRQVACCESSWAAPLECVFCRLPIDGLAVACGIRWPDAEGEPQSLQRWAHRACLPRYAIAPEAHEENRAHREGLDA
jgi:hypothetical protein